MSDSNRLRVSIIKESTYGVTPTSPAMQIMPVTGQSLRDAVGYTQSNIINADRNVEELVRLSKTAGGQLPTEVMFSPTGEALELLLCATMCASETAVATVASCSTVVSTKTITRASGSFVSDGITVGDIVRTSGGSTAANNGYWKVTNVVALTLTVEADANFTADTVTVTRGARRNNGINEDSFTIEVARLDVDKAQIFTGCVVNTMDISVSDEAIVGATFTFASANSTFQTTDLGTDQFIAGATYDPATDHPVLDSLSVPEIRSAGSAFGAKTINLTINNNVMPRTELGTLGATSMRQGEFNTTGNVEAYFEDFTELQAYADNTEGAIWFALIDANSQGYTFSMPTVKFNDAGADVTGSNTDTMVSIGYQATLNHAQSCTVRMQRWA
jgi:hypothetical protein